MIKAREDVFSLWLGGSVANCCGSAVQGWDAVERVPTHPLILSILSKPPVAGDRINGIIQNWEGSWPQRRRDTEGKKPERKFETRYLVSYEGKTSGQGWDAVERVPTESSLASVLL